MPPTPQVKDDEVEELCTCCGEWKVESEFRGVGSGKRGPVCKDCRNWKDRESERAKRRNETLKDLTRIRRCESVEKLLTIVDSVAVKLGGIGHLVRSWIELATDKNATDQQRFRVSQTMLRMLELIENNKKLSAITEESDASTIIGRLHDHGRLLPVVRAMLADGRLTLDDIDPAPSDHLTE